MPVRLTVPKQWAAVIGISRPSDGLDLPQAEQDLASARWRNDVPFYVQCSKSVFEFPKLRISRGKILNGGMRALLAILCAVSLAQGHTLEDMQATGTAQASSSAQTAKISSDQLDSLVAPIALYPDPMLAQTLAACTYPLEIIQLQQWLSKNPGLKDKALADATAKQPWDPSIQAMAALPDVVKRLADDIQWTTDLGNA